MSRVESFIHVRGEGAGIAAQQVKPLLAIPGSNNRALVGVPVTLCLMQPPTSALAKSVQDDQSAWAQPSSSKNVPSTAIANQSDGKVQSIIGKKDLSLVYCQ